MRGFKRPDGVTEKQMDAAIDGGEIDQFYDVILCSILLFNMHFFNQLGDVLVIIDLQRDDPLVEAGFARAVLLYRSPLEYNMFSFWVVK